MNIFALLFKQMRQRSLSTALTLLSVMLGVALAVAIMICQREGRAAFGQTDYGYNVLIGPKGSGLQLVMNTVYHIDVSQGNVPFEEYEALARRTGSLPKEFAPADATQPAAAPRSPYPGPVSWVVPYAVGDSYKGFRIVATMPILFGANPDGKPIVVPEGDARAASHIPEYRPGHRYTIAQGQPFAYNKFEAVIGSEVAAATGLKVGDKFQATHGMPKEGETPDIHDEIWTVVGVLDKTFTANDRVLFIPLMSFYSIWEHAEGLDAIADIASNTRPAPKPAATQEEEAKAYTLNPDGTINLKLPKDKWEISAILLKTPPTTQGQAIFVYKNRPDTMAVNPATVMAEFFDDILGSIVEMFRVMAGIVVVVAAVSILVSIYNSVAARNREVAILRALGATKTRILTLVCLEATFIGLMGGIAGLVAGHLAAAAASAYLAQWIGHGIAWWRAGWMELLYLGVVVLVSFAAGLVPAFKAFRTQVAANLVAE